MVVGIFSSDVLIPQRGFVIAPLCRSNKTRANIFPRRASLCCGKN